LQYLKRLPDHVERVLAVSSQCFAAYGRAHLFMLLLLLPHYGRLPPLRRLRLMPPLFDNCDLTAHIPEPQSISRCQGYEYSYGGHCEQFGHLRTACGRLNGQYPNSSLSLSDCSYTSAGRTSGQGASQFSIPVILNRSVPQCW